MDSFEIFGIDDKLNQSPTILIKPFKETNKLLHLEFETNPINSNSDYKIKGLSQSLQITYHAVLIYFIYLYFI